MTGSSRREALVACAVGALAWAGLLQVVPDPPVNGDGLRGLLMARDCVELDVCRLTGGESTIPGFFEGAWWTEFLAGLTLLHASSLTVLRVVLALTGCGVATLYLVVRRWIDPALALAGAIAMVAFVALNADEMSLLRDLAPLPFLGALATGTLLIGAFTGRLDATGAAAIVIGVAIDAWAGAVCLVPALLAVTAAAPKRPWLALLLALVGCVGTMGVLSFDATALQAAGQRSAHRIPIEIIALVGTVGTGLACRVWFGRWSALARAAFVGAWLVAPYVLGALWVLHAERRILLPRYLLIVASPVGFVLAAAILAPLRLIAGRTPLASAAAVLLTAGLFGWGAVRWKPQIPAFTQSSWTFEDGRRIAAVLEARGWTYAQLFAGLETSDAGGLLAAMAPYLPHRAHEPPRDPRRHLEIRRERAPPRNPAMVSVSLRGGWWATLREVSSWVDTSQAEVCRRPPQGPSECGRVTGDGPEVRGPAFEYWSRAFRTSSVTPAAHTVTYQYAVQPAGAGARELTLLDGVDASPCGWRLAAVQGLTVTGRLPASQARLISESGARAEVTFEADFGAGCPPPEMERPPSFFESRAADVTLRPEQEQR